MELDLVDIIRSVCPHCAAGKTLRRRDSTGEWTHEWKLSSATQAHTFCLATHLRNDPKYRDLIRG